MVKHEGGLEIVAWEISNLRIIPMLYVKLSFESNMVQKKKM